MTEQEKVIYEMRDYATTLRGPYTDSGFVSLKLRDWATRLEALAPPADLAPVAKVEGYCMDCHRPKSGPYPPVDLCGCATLHYPPASNVSKVEGGEAVACWRWTHTRGGHESWFDGQPSKADLAVALNQSWKVQYAYTHPAPPALSAEDSLLDWMNYANISGVGVY